MKYAPRFMMVAVLIATPAAAQSSQEDAPSLFQRGAALVREGRCNDALEPLERSFAREPSPNSQLLLARCHRDLGREDEAWVRYGRTIELAEQRIAAGEFRYQATHDVASLERRELESRLVVLSVRVTGADAATTISSGRLRVRASQTSELRLRPGSHTVMVSRGDGAHLEQTVLLELGKPRTITFVFPPVPVPPSTPSETTSALVPIAVTSLGIGALGAATFALFKLRTESVYRDGERCTPHCPPEFRDDVSRAKTEQALAYTGLAIGIAGLALGTGLLIYSAGKPARKTALELGPASVRLKIQF